MGPGWFAGPPTWAFVVVVFFNGWGRARTREEGEKGAEWPLGCGVESCLFYFIFIF